MNKPSGDPKLVHSCRDARIHREVEQEIWRIILYMMGALIIALTVDAGSALKAFIPLFGAIPIANAMWLGSRLKKHYASTREMDTQVHYFLLLREAEARRKSGA